MKKLIFLLLLCNTYFVQGQCPDLSSVPSELVCNGAPYIFTLSSSGGVPGNWSQYGVAGNLTQTLPYSATYTFTPFPEIPGCYNVYNKTIYLFESPLPIFDESTFPYLICPGSTPPSLPMPINGVQGVWQQSTINPSFPSIYTFFPTSTVSGCSTKAVSKYIAIGNVAQFADFPVSVGLDSGGNTVATCYKSIAATPLTTNFPTLPTTSLPTVVFGSSYPAITGTWSPSLITYFHGVKEYVFTPNPGQCAFDPVKLYINMEANLFNPCGVLQELKNPEEELNRTYLAYDIVASDNYQVSTSNQNIVLSANLKVDLLPNTTYLSGSFFEARIDENQCPAPNKQVGNSFIGELQELKSLTIFPNPSSNLIEITIENEKFNKVLITSIDGKIVLDRQIPETEFLQLDVSEYSKGLYIVQVVSKEGKSFSQKLIKN